LLALALLGLAARGVGHATLVQAAPAAQAPTQPPSAREGHAIYQENCAACHGVRGAGDGPTAAELSNPATAFADPQIGRQAIPSTWFQVTKEGRMSLFMPPWKNRLTDEQIWDVVATALTLHTSSDELARGQTVWAAQCADCHGDLGVGDGPQAVASGWQMPSFADLAYTSERSLNDWFQAISQGQGNMPALGGQLAEDDIWAAVAYARTFSYQPLTAVAMPTGDGRVSGVVSNGTPGGDSVAGLTVTLRPFQDFEALPTQEVTVAADGAFSFAELPTAADFSYLLTATYKDVDFSSDLITFEDGLEQAATLAVYEAGTTPGDIRVDLAQWFVDYQDGALLVGELYRLTHDSDSVYTGGAEVAPGKRTVLQFDLPDGYTSLAVDGGVLGDRFVLTPEGVVDTQPLPPGQSQLLLRYLLPYEGARAELAHAVRYPVSRFSALVNQGPTVEVEGLAQAGTQAAGDRVFDNYEAVDVAAGQPISIQLRDLARVAGASATNSQSPAVLANSPVLLYGLAAAAIAAIAAVLVFALVWPRPPAQLAPVGASPRTEGQASPAPQRRRLLQAIADLDDSYAAGEIDAASYTGQRAALKRSLVAATSQAHESAPNPGSDQPAAEAPTP
jgi:mono/diheme cytochrome c family protein